MLYPDRDGMEGRDRQRALLAEAEEHRLAKLAGPQRPSVARRGARMVGRTLVLLGVRMLRYGQSEASIFVEAGRTGSPSASLN